MKSLLAGATGLVGSNIARSSTFSAHANSRNFRDFTGDHFDLIVFAAAPAVKWWANENPESDAATMRSLVTTLETISAERFVLISTIDVYPTPQKVDESVSPTEEAGTVYGKNRFWLEEQIRQLYPVHHVLRLPGLFGPGLKKNVLFDLIRGNMLEKVNLDSTLQWYPLTRIWEDIQRAMTAELKLVNLATEPLGTRQIHSSFFPELKVGADPAPTVGYDMRTIFADAFGSTTNGYIMNSKQVLSEMENWLRKPQLVISR